jgi:hypothetical protein
MRVVAAGVADVAFGHGLEAGVIWCCNSSWTAYWYDVERNGFTPPLLRTGKWTDQLPVDTRQHPFIVWSDPADLRKKLTDKSRALGFDVAWNRGQQ